MEKYIASIFQSSLWIILRTYFFRYRGFIFTLIIILFSIQESSAQAPYGKPNLKAATKEGERLKALIDFKKMEREIMSATRMSHDDYHLFQKFIKVRWMNDEVAFFGKVAKGEITESNLNQYVEELKKSYLLLYPDFLKGKEQLLREDAEEHDKVLVINGPCTNIGFEEGTFNGWAGTYGDRGLTGNDPTNPRAGFNLHCIMTPGMTDPLIPGLSVLAPGSTRSVRLGNTINGGHAAKMVQTFRVDSSNMIFTYRYAVVLEDPQDHDDEERPYFKVRMFTESGQEITCAAYTVLAQPNIPGYNRVCVNANGDAPRGSNDDANIGCAPNPSNPTAGNTIPAVNNDCPNNNLDIYYNNWTTVSIPLNAYYMQNVRIEFTASDCEPSGHLGYAYVDAECSPFSVLNPETICTVTNQTKTLTAPNGFASYRWVGPANSIVGGTSGGTVSTAQTITVNKPGVYQMTLTPVSDNPCPVTTNVTINEYCPPPPVTVSLCESVAGSGTATAVNLDTYRPQVTAHRSPTGTVLSWHSGSPARTTNRITTTSNLTIRSGDRFYAYVDHVDPLVGSDTVMLTFVINPKPVINFPAIPDLCLNAPAHQISGVTPSGGSFTSSTAGAQITTAGLITPSAVGSFSATYTVANSQGCTNLLMRPYIVKAVPTVEAGNTQKFCANNAAITLAGSVTNSLGGTWSGGGGTFTSGASALTGTYIPSSAEISSGSVTLALTTTGTAPCPAVSDNVTYTFEALPAVNAGTDQSFCSSVSTIPLNAIVTNGPSWTWSGGGGIFAPANTLTGTYAPTDAEKAAGSVTLTLRSTGTTVCPVATDAVTYTFEKIRVVNAGNDQTLCATNPSYQLSGSVTHASGGLWSGGRGTFSAGPSSLIGTYTPSVSELTNGLVTLTLTTTGAGNCPHVSDNVTITFEASPQVNAGTDQSFCSTVSSITMNASVTNAPTWSWSGAAGIFAPANTLNGTYTPSDAEKTTGSVVLTLTSSGNLVCPAVSDVVVYSFGKTPEANAGSDQALCAGAPNVSLNGTIINAPGGSWSGAGGTFVSGANSPNGTYIPSGAEIAAGSVTLTLTTAPFGDCPQDADQVTITFEAVPQVNAGTDQQFCATVTMITLDATTTNAPSWSWSGGGGIFSPANTLNGTYLPTDAERAAGSVTLTLTSVGTLVCPSISDAVTYSFEPIPSVEAGPAQTVCANNISINLQASKTNASGIVWSGGNGSYTASPNDMNINYFPSPAEISNGSVTLTLTSTGSILCPAATDQVVITISPAPTINAGADQTVCADNASVTLSGSVTVAGGIAWTNGRGIFNPDAQTLNAVYSPSPGEIAAGRSQLIIISTNNGTCLPVKDTMLIHIIPLPVIEAGENRVSCIGTQVSLQVDALPNVTYAWQKENGQGAGNTNAITVAVLLGEEMYYVTATDNYSCRYEDSVKVIGIPTPVIVLRDTAICENQSVLLNANPTNISNPLALDPNFEWYQNGSLLPNATSQLLVTEQGSYTVKVSLGTCSSSGASNVTVSPLPVPALPDQIKFCSETTSFVELDAGPGAIYLWQPTQETTQKILVTSTGGYSVLVTNEFNCSTADQVNVIQACPPRLFISNSFSPNKDGSNERYNVYGAHFTNFKMVIFNRWGEIIFESAHRSNVWDGTYRDMPIPIGVYPWIITYEGDSEEYKGPYKLEGSVTVVR